MRIAIFSTIYKEEIEVPLCQTVNFLLKHGVEVLIERDFYTQIANKLKDFPACKTINTNELNTDLVISIGGDGTFLTTAACIGDKNIPILGINTGRLGFLADVAHEEIETILQELIDGDYHVEERTVLELSTSDKSEKIYPFALNEVAILKQDLSSMISIHASVNNEFLNTYQADGLIVATPTGSTAYSMSVGGPILVPQAQDLIIAPVASHSLNVRPLIIPDSWHIDLEIDSRSKSFLVSMDGRSQVMHQTTKLHIAKANYTIKVVKPLEHSFFKTLKNKLMWGADKRN
ncbi:MAG TPA: NAD kinase [Paludibacteraceae bacterium]|nr:NAD kinase [Paludibacteraceae bacterium]HQB68538.1 NAD kinase [Paludibacteraceae bacterium]HRS67039.1 NAD kinase [Paludibacteraceae bacterium]